MMTMWNVLESALGTILGIVLVGAVLIIYERRQLRRCHWHKKVDCPTCRPRQKTQRKTS